MEYLFGFICALFKIAIQASLYATTARWLVRLADTQRVNSTLVRTSR